MANIPIINPPDKEHLGFCWHHQFTIPLLFDDCLSLLQKVCALWAKLNDVIDALNEFNDEFNGECRDKQGYEGGSQSAGGGLIARTNGN